MPTALVQQNLYIQSTKNRDGPNRVANMNRGLDTGNGRAQANLLISDRAIAQVAANPRMYNAIINSNNPQLSNIIRQQQRQGNINDPFSKVNLKARNIIESVERNRHSTAERRTGSTGGSSDSNVVDLTQIQ